MKIIERYASNGNDLPVWTVRNREQKAPLFGVCSFEAVVETDEPAVGLSIQIEFGGFSRTLPLKAVISATTSSTVAMNFNVHTVLLPNGLQKLKVSITSADGSQLDFPTSVFEIDNAGGLAELVRRDLSAFGTPAIVGRVLDSTLYPYASGRAVAWFTPPLKTSPPELSMDPARDSESARRHLQHWGFCILSASLPSELIEAFNREIDEAIANGNMTPALSLEGNGGATQSIARVSERSFFFQPLTRFLRDWFRDEPCACQLQLFLRGGERTPHQDTIDLTAYPGGYMCGVSIALEDVEPGAGEIVIYPGSHRTERCTASSLHLEKVSLNHASRSNVDVMTQAILQAGEYKPVFCRPKAGQITVFHENLIHGESQQAIADLTRRRLAIHYFAKGGVAYHDSIGTAARLELAP
jgi:hypothetical protein